MSDIIFRLVAIFTVCVVALGIKLIDDEVWIVGAVLTVIGGSFGVLLYRNPYHPFSRRKL